MAYWLDLFTPYTWTRFQEHGASISGYRPRQRHTAARVKPGDLFLCYLVKLSRWCGVLEVTSPAFEDLTPIFAEESDPYSIRFKVAPTVILDFEHSVPIEELWDQLSFTRTLVRGSVGWAQRAKLRQSLFLLGDEDGDIIKETLLEQVRSLRVFKLDAADLRHIGQRTFVRTETGEVEVEVPEREDEQSQSEQQLEPRASLLIQAKVVQLGAALGFNIWVPRSDRGKIAELLPANYHASLLNALPLNFNEATQKTIENIDVLWLQRRAIHHAFEVEHTTAIYSGLLRMADLLAMQPRINISLHIVAPTERRDQVRREIVRPVFSVMEGGAMAERCSFLPYEAVDEILRQPNLAHMRETIIEDYEEYFDVV